jgi:hypothetical protein
MKHLYALVATFIIAVVPSFADQSSSDAMKTPLIKENLKFLPVPDDCRNYYVLQAFENETNILIGDFGGAEKIICLVMDKGCDGTIDGIVEYYPEINKYVKLKVPTTKLFTNLTQMKKDIIEGNVFRDPRRADKNLYTHVMASMPLLLEKMNEGMYVTKRGANGRYVRCLDPDLKKTTMADFFFGKDQNAYSLQFRTVYYKSGLSKIEPAIQYSVFCKDTRDPVVAEYVERLLKMADELRL